MTPSCAAYALAPASPMSWAGVSFLCAFAALALVLSSPPAWAAPSAPDAPPPPAPPPPADSATATTGTLSALLKDTQPRFYIREYRVDGAGNLLKREEIEEAVYPFLGPYRTAGDVEQARAALEQAYHDKGYQTVTVSIPRQPRSAAIHLLVSLGEVGRVRIVGSRFFSLDEIRREAPSLEEGQSPNFSQVTQDIIALNQSADRRVTPTVRPGEIPGTVDVDLTVKDTFPLHGSLELNNRYSASTTQLRLNGSVNYDNLWQMEHAVGFSFQTAPEDTNQVQVYSAYYLARIPGIDWLSLMAQGTYQDSNVNTLGGIGVVGKGKILGLRANISLPALTNYYHSISLGIDYKHFDQDLMIAGVPEVSPVTYFPFSAAYSGSWINRSAQDQTRIVSETDLNASVNFSIRELDSDEDQFNTNRSGADGSYIYVRGDISHTHELPGGFQLFAKLQGQVAEKPLVSSEQLSAGGLGTVRGYLEAEEIGDNGLIESAEFRTPSLGDFLGKTVDDWRFYIFAEAAQLTINDPLIEQQDNFKLASVGLGTRVKLQDHYNGSFDFGLPLDNGTNTQAYEPLMTFRVWAEF